MPFEYPKPGNTLRALDGRPLPPVTKDYARNLSHDNRVAPTEEHKRGVTENMQKEFDKARGLKIAGYPDENERAPGKLTAEFSVKCYRAFAERLLTSPGTDQPGEEHVMKNRMIVAETESWRRTDKRIYRIFKNDEDVQGIFATSDLDALVVKLWELGAL